MTRNTRKKAIPVIILAGILAVSVLVMFFVKNENRQNDLLPVTLTAIKTNHGWGYQILVDGKIFIKQESLPAVSGEVSFKNKEQALAVGNLAVKKIVSGKMPSITIEELKLLKVLD